MQKPKPATPLPPRTLSASATGAREPWKQILKKSSLQNADIFFCFEIPVKVHIAKTKTKMEFRDENLERKIERWVVKLAEFFRANLYFLMCKIFWRWQWVIAHSENNPYRPTSGKRKIAYRIYKSNVDNRWFVRILFNAKSNIATDRSAIQISFDLSKAWKWIDWQCAHVHGTSSTRTRKHSKSTGKVRVRGFQLFLAVRCTWPKCPSNWKIFWVLPPKFCPSLCENLSAIWTQVFEYDTTVFWILNFLL